MNHEPKEEKMKLIEQFMGSKSPDPSLCEDGIFVSGHFAAIIDGVTSKTWRKYDHETPGKACTRLLIKKLENLPFRSSAYEAIEYLTAAIFTIYKELGIEEQVRNSPTERAAASIVIYSRDKNQIWMVGDCQCMVDGTIHTNSKRIDTLLSDVRSLYLQTELSLGKTIDELKTHDTGREFILPLLEGQSMFQNPGEKTGFSYGVLDGFRVPEREIRVIQLSDPKTIILASDGYPCLYETLEKSEKYLEKILRNDPLCFQTYKSTKGLKPGNLSFDDRAYLRLEAD